MVAFKGMPEAQFFRDGFSSRIAGSELQRRFGAASNN
jgi:hypothetical protein